MLIIKQPKHNDNIQMARLTKQQFELKIQIRARSGGLSTTLNKKSDALVSFSDNQYFVSHFDCKIVNSV